MDFDEDVWPLKLEARLSALEVTLSGVASATGTRRAIARALETAADRMAADPECAASHSEYGAALREACLNMAQQLLRRPPEDKDTA